MREKKDSRHLWTTIQTNTSIGEKVRVKPHAELDPPLGTPWIGEDPPALYLDKSASLIKISYTHGMSQTRAKLHPGHR